MPFAYALPRVECKVGGLNACCVGETNLAELLAAAASASRPGEVMESFLLCCGLLPSMSREGGRADVGGDAEPEGAGLRREERSAIVTEGWGIQREWQVPEACKEWRSSCKVIIEQPNGVALR